MDLFKLKHINSIIFTFPHIQRQQIAAKSLLLQRFYPASIFAYSYASSKYSLPTKFFGVDRQMISFDFHHLGTFFCPELACFPPYSPSFEGAILDSKFENVGPTLSSLLCADTYA